MVKVTLVDHSTAGRPRLPSHQLEMVHLHLLALKMDRQWDIAGLPTMGAPWMETMTPSLSSHLDLVDSQ